MKWIAAWMVLLLQAVPPSPTASIEGVVIRAGSNEPIAGAQLTLTQAGGAGAESEPAASRVTTDREGRFRFDNLDAGAYELLAMSNGYDRREFGQRRPGLPGAPIVLTPGQALKDVEIHLTQAGNVSGHVRTLSGRPAPGVSVALVRRYYDRNGKRTFSSIARTRSDDRGEYRFYWITPGRYYVVAGSPSPDLGENEGRSVNEVVRNYPLIFFRGAMEFEKAVAIDVRPGGETDAIDFLMPQTGQYRIHGRVVDPGTGKAPLEAVAGISYWGIDGTTGFSGGTTYNRQTGTIEFSALTPRTYEIAVSAGNLNFMVFGDSTANARATVTVSNADIDLGVLTMEPAAVISGRIPGEIPPRDPASTNPLRLVFFPESGRSVIQSFVAPDGTFTWNFPYPSFRARVSGLPTGVYLREARLNGADALNAAVLVSRSNTLEIVLGSNPGTIEGVVRNERAQPAADVTTVLVPDVRIRTELFREVVSDQSGRFSISNIPPGDYKLFAWEALERYAYFDPEILRKYEAMGRTIRVLESSNQTFDLEMIPAGVE